MLKSIFNLFKREDTPSTNEKLFKSLLTDIAENCDSINIEDKEHILIMPDWQYYDLCELARKERWRLDSFTFLHWKTNQDVVLRGCYIDDVITTRGFYGVFLKYKSRYDSYHHHKLETYKTAFPQASYISTENYKKFQPDFESYGFTFATKDGRLIIYHPEEEE